MGLVLDTDLKILGFTKANLGAGKGPPFKNEPLSIWGTLRIFEVEEMKHWLFLLLAGTFFFLCTNFQT